MEMLPRIVIAVQNRLQIRAGKHFNGPLLITTYYLLHNLFLLDTIGAFIYFLVCIHVFFVLSTNGFAIIRLGIAALFIILQQLMLPQLLAVHFLPI